MRAQDREQPLPQGPRVKPAAVRQTAWHGGQQERIAPASCSLSPRPVHTGLLSYWLSIQFQISGHWEKPKQSSVPFKRVVIMGLAESLKAELCPVCH